MLHLHRTIALGRSQQRSEDTNDFGTTTLEVIGKLVPAAGMGLVAVRNSLTMGPG